MSLTSQLIEFIRPLGNCVIAFSGGVDSTVVAKAARLALGSQRSLAVTAISPSVAKIEIEDAQRLAAEIGIRHQLISTREIENENYVANNGQRCFHCKSELYSRLQAIAENLAENATLLNGTNHDDLGDYRPGLQAANDFQIQSPLADLQLTKSDVRQIAKEWGISVWDKPAAPCLASRIAYGEQVTPEKLRMIEAAEGCLRQQGFIEFRVRFHPGKLARIEVNLAELDRLLEPEMRQEVTRQLKALGFQTVSVDLEGFRSGNLNQALPTYQIRTTS